MTENIIVILISLTVSAIAVYFIDKKFGGTDDSHEG